MPSPLYRDKFRRPSLFLTELIRKSSQGQLVERGDYPTFLYRAVVVAVDVKGGQLENLGGSGQVAHTIDGKSFQVQAIVGPDNPKNSVKARIISNGFDQFTHDDNLRIFWPFFPESDGVPVKPGEHVYVVFEDENFEHGLWITKMPGHENVNYYRGEKSYNASNAGSLATLYPQGQGAGSSQNQLNTDDSATESRPDGQLASLFPAGGSSGGTT